MTGYQIRPATRELSKPLIGLYGLSGGGKTMSALLIARGLAGPEGKIVLIDTEQGRGELYADVIPGGYDVMRLAEPFSPENYMSAMKAAFAAKPAAVVLDSGSHEWEGVGGVLDMAAENESRSGKSGLHNWKTPKMSHGKFMFSLLQSPCPVICCLRAKYKTRQAKDPKTGKQVIVKDEHVTPMQSDDFIYETTVHGEVFARPDKTGELYGGYLRLMKCSQPDLRSIFSTDRQLGVGTGEAIRAWAESAGKEAPAATAPSPSNGSAYDPVEAARAAARQGTEAFRTWWNGEGKTVERREAVKPHLDELKKIAAAADAADVPEEDPFSGSDGPGDPETPAGGNGEPAGPYEFADHNGELTACQAHVFADLLEREMRACKSPSMLENLWSANQAGVQALASDEDAANGPEWADQLARTYAERKDLITPKAKAENAEASA